MIAIIIPAHNEEKRIGETLDRYGKYFENLKKKKEIDDFEIIVVINNTHDRTEDVVKPFCKRFPEIRYLNFKEGGKGFAIIRGFKDAIEKNSDLIGFVDADMATPPEAFHDLVKNIKDCDGVIASRWMKKSIIKMKQTMLRQITSRVFNFLTRSILLLPFKDTQCGAKLFKRKAIQSVIDEIGTTRWAFDIDLLYRMKMKHYKIKEVPAVWEDKADSKLNLKRVPLQMFSAVIRLRLTYSPLRFIVRAYDLLPEMVKIHNVR